MSATTLEAPLFKKRRKALPERTRLLERFPPKYSLDRRIVHLWDGLEGAAYRVNYFDKDAEAFPESYFVLVKGPSPADMEVWAE